MTIDLDKLEIVPDAKDKNGDEIVPGCFVHKDGARLFVLALMANKANGATVVWCHTGNNVMAISPTLVCVNDIDVTDNKALYEIIQRQQQQIDALLAASPARDAEGMAAAASGRAGAGSMPLLADLRKRFGLTQCELAELAGISTTTVNAYENGRAYPTRDNFNKIRRTLIDLGWSGKGFLLAPAADAGGGK